MNNKNQYERKMKIVNKYYKIKQLTKTKQKNMHNV